MFLILLLFFNFGHKNLHIFALPSSAVLKPAQAGLVNHFTDRVIPGFNLSKICLPILKRSYLALHVLNSDLIVIIICLLTEPAVLRHIGLVLKRVPDRLVPEVLSGI